MRKARKTCTKCQKNKPDSAFGVRKDRPSGKRSQCKTCENTYKKSHRTWKGSKEYSAYQIAWRSHRTQEIKGKIVEEMGGKCKRCGKSFPLPAFDFDHLPGEKKLKDVGALISAGKEQEAKEEATKCQLLCACCHRIVTNERVLMRRKGSGDPPELLNRGDLVELVWLDATEDSVGNPDNSYCAVRKTYGMFLMFNDNGPDGAIVLSTTKDEDDIEQSGWSAYPVGMVQYVKLIRRAPKSDKRRRGAKQ